MKHAGAEARGRRRPRVARGSDQAAAEVDRAGGGGDEGSGLREEGRPTTPERVAARGAARRRRPPGTASKAAELGLGKAERAAEEAAKRAAKD